MHGKTHYSFATSLCSHHVVAYGIFNYTNNIHTIRPYLWSFPQPILWVVLTGIDRLSVRLKVLVFKQPSLRQALLPKIFKSRHFNTAFSQPPKTTRDHVQGNNSVSLLATLPREIDHDAPPMASSHSSLVTQPYIERAEIHRGHLTTA